MEARLIKWLLRPCFFFFFLQDLLDLLFISVSFDGVKKTTESLLQRDAALLPSLELPCCYKLPPPSPFRMWERAGARALLIVYPLGLMKRCSADFNTFLQCALFLEARRQKKKKKNAEPSAHRSRCDERTCDTRIVQIVCF